MSTQKPFELRKEGLLSYSVEIGHNHGETLAATVTSTATPKYDGAALKPRPSSASSKSWTTEHWVYNTKEIKHDISLIGMTFSYPLLRIEEVCSGKGYKTDGFSLIVFLPFLLTPQQKHQCC